MSDSVKIALIIAGAILVAVGAYIYFSPYQSCVRAQTKMFGGGYQDPGTAARVLCARNSN